MKRIFIAFVLILLTAVQALAQATFGAEFTFTNSLILSAQTDGHIVNNEQSEAHRDRMAEQALRSCGGCRAVREENAYGVETVKIIYPDGFYFVIATDPAVVEVQMKPQTTLEIARNRQRIERDIFGAARAVGMAPHQSTGGGHIHVGFLSSTQGDLMLLRNIIVDFANHSEIADGLLASDHWNSPPISALPKEKQDALARIIADVDRGVIKNTRALAQRIQNEVYDWHRADWSPTKKYQALNLTRIADRGWEDAEKTFEIRSIRPEKTGAEFEILARLFEGRIEYLKHLNKPIPLQIKAYGLYGNAEAKYESFARYVAESGLSFETFRRVFQFDNSSVASRTTVYKPFILCRRAVLF
jgi:hypothetical protein